MQVDETDVGLIPGLGRSRRGGNRNPLQYSCLENPMDRGTWLQNTGLQKLDTTEGMHAHTSHYQKKTKKKP